MKTRQTIWLSIALLLLAISLFFVSAQVISTTLSKEDEAKYKEIIESSEVINKATTLTRVTSILKLNSKEEVIDVSNSGVDFIQFSKDEKESDKPILIRYDQ